MPKLGMEPIRRAALVKATIREVGLKGTTEVTVSQIAHSAGVSSALAHHYFGGKEQILSAAMRQILKDFGAEVRKLIHKQTTPRERLDAIVRASFAPSNFESETISAWLVFYVASQTSPEAQRLLRVYQKRLHSNLCHELRQIAGHRADALAVVIAAMIDGVYLRAALSDGPADGRAAMAQVRMVMDAILSGSGMEC